MKIKQTTSTLKSIMKHLSKIAMVAAAAALVSQAAEAAFTPNDLYLGFNESGAQSDYIIDLGQATSAVGVGGSSVKDLSSLFSSNTFNNVFTSGADGVNVAVVGANNQFPSYDIYATQVRVGGAGAPAVAESDLTTAASYESILSAAAATLTGNPWPTAGTGTADSTESFTAKVGPTQVSGNFFSRSGVNPFGTIDGSSVIYLDLWHATVASAYAYLGYFTLDLSGSAPRLAFTPAAAVVSIPPPQPRLSITRTGNVSSISFLSSSSVTYKLFYTNSAGLITPVSSWPSLPGTIAGDGTTKTFQDTTTDPLRVYRVQAQ